jgi:hypothetical protein
MRDSQMHHLLRVLQMPSCKIWCLNIGETYRVSTQTWRQFADGLKKTNVTHMYASEHTIGTPLKGKMHDIIWTNRSKHSMHNNPNNLPVIRKCTHCWWNPINSKRLRLCKQGANEHKIQENKTQGAPSHGVQQQNYTPPSHRVCAWFPHCQQQVRWCGGWNRSHGECVFLEMRRQMGTWPLPKEMEEEMTKAFQRRKECLRKREYRERIRLKQTR